MRRISSSMKSIPSSFLESRRRCLFDPSHAPFFRRHPVELDRFTLRPVHTTQIHDQPSVDEDEYVVVAREREHLAAGVAEGCVQLEGERDHSPIVVLSVVG
jgi:hypothetical protein